VLFREPERGPVRRDTLLDDVCLTRPDAERVLFEEFKLPCYDCEVRMFETVEQACSYYGLDPDAMVARLNQLELGPEEEQAS
jgi:hybrid cluster-associated redox disulfide protein